MTPRQIHHEVRHQSRLFHAALPSLLAEHEGRWCLWLDGPLGFYATMDDAMRESDRRFGFDRGPVIARVEAQEPVLAHAALAFDLTGQGARDQVTERLGELAMLPDDWNVEDGEPSPVPTARAIEQARRVAFALLDEELAPEIDADVMGGVAVEVTDGDTGRRATVVCSNGGDVIVLMNRGDGSVPDGKRWADTDAAQIALWVVGLVP